MAAPLTAEQLTGDERAARSSKQIEIVSVRTG